MVYFAWHAIQKASAESTLNKYKKDLFLSDVNAVNPPSFTLTDQHGKVISLADFKNKKLVIQPMDPECKDVCPLISEELINANKQLGSEAQNVVYIGLNVNEYHNKVSDVKAFSDQHGLSSLKNWYFLTGSPDTLKKIWKAYGIAVVPNKDGDVMHTAVLIFVNSSGKETYEGNPQNQKSSVKEWSDAISFILKQIS
jgi:cytochrome oxidase Cu insertion factor (SCO1/SenC/PrrC family)